MLKKYVITALLCVPIYSMEYFKSVLFQDAAAQDTEEVETAILNNNTAEINNFLLKLNFKESKIELLKDFRTLCSFLSNDEILLDSIELLADICDLKEIENDAISFLFLKDAVRRDSTKLVQWYFDRVKNLNKFCFLGDEKLLPLLEIIFIGDNIDIFKVLEANGLDIHCRVPIKAVMKNDTDLQLNPSSLSIASIAGCYNAPIIFYYLKDKGVLFDFRIIARMADASFLARLLRDDVLIWKATIVALFEERRTDALNEAIELVEYEMTDETVKNAFLSSRSEFVIEQIKQRIMSSVTDFLSTMQ